MILHACYGNVAFMLAASNSVFHMKATIIFLLLYIKSRFVTGFGTIDQIVTLGLCHFITPANSCVHLYVHYPFTMPLSGLADWSAFL